MRRLAWLALPSLLACSESPSAGAPRLRFVRGGIVRGVNFEPRSWTAGEVVDGVTAPIQPECVATLTVELEDMGRLAALDAPAPGAAVAFSPDGRWLAIGSDAGSLRVVDSVDGSIRHTMRIAEGAVKRVAWSPDGATLYLGEQSPDAELIALDTVRWEVRWRKRLADELESSPAPAGDDIYGLYSLPGVYALEVLPDGDLLVGGAHGWTPSDGSRRNRSRLWRLGSDGAQVSAWPEAGPADAILLHPAVGPRQVLVGVSRSAEGPAPADMPVGGVVALDVATLRPLWSRRFEALVPHFRDVFLWEAAGVDDSVALAGLGDGRAFLMDPAGGDLRSSLSPGVPVLAQGVPIAAGVGFGTVVAGNAYFLTTVTNIPWGAADPMARPPAVHPAEHVLHAHAADGTPLWSRHAEHALQGVVPSPDGGLLAVAGAERSTDHRTDLFGVLLFDRSDGRIVTSCATSGPAWFRPAWASDGRLAVAEAPFLDAAGAVQGAYRVTIFR
jgi:outer membrane protein assembly factor BamB